MFTGIIESVGKVVSVQTMGTNRIFEVESPISAELKVDQSLSHNGVCLTITAMGPNSHQVTAVDETLQKSNLGDLKPGASINLERAMVANGRFDGHVVQGHVDTTATCSGVTTEDGSWIFSFKLAEPHKGLIVEKGSICIDGVSLTCFNVTSDSFVVAIIPYTFENTCFQDLKEGGAVNIEFDIIGKYVRSITTGSDS